MRKRKHQPPSKVKYNKSHPTVSIRVSSDLYAKLKDLREKSGKSLGDILREALSKQAPTAQRAFDRGCAKAREIFQVTYACSVCGGLMQVTSTDEKQAIARYMRESGWHHVNCPNK